MSDDLREQAKQRIQGRRNFWQLLITLAVVTVLLNLIWLLTSPDHYYWPMWPMLGFALALVFGALRAFSPIGPITDAHIDAEVRKMGGDQGDSSR